MPITILYPRNVKSNEAGFNWLADVSHRILPLWKDSVIFDARHLRFFDANLCAPFGALLHDAQRNEIEIDLGHVSGKVLEVWGKNYFFTEFGGTAMNDEFDTTLAYQQFDMGQSPQEFAEYLDYELMSRDRDLPPMTEETRYEFMASVHEIFANAQSHSQSREGIFGCGQFFPGRDRLSFTLADLGVGFRRNVEARMGRKCKDEDAIEWATQPGHTTRAAGGGYGLATLREFFRRNGGRMQIVSEKGFWELDGEKVRTTQLHHSFPGSFVNLEINTADQTSDPDLATALNAGFF